VPPYTIDHQKLARHESSKVKSPRRMPMFANQLTDEWSFSTRRAVHRPALSSCPISLDHGLQSASQNSLDYGLQVRTIMASKCFSKLARSWPPSASPNWLDDDLQVYLPTRSIKASKFIYKLARSRPPSVSPNSLEYNLQMHLQTRSITASKRIS